MRISVLIGAAACALALQSFTLAAEPSPAPADKVALEAQYQSIAEPQIDESKLSDQAYRDDAEKRIRAYNAERAKLAKRVLEISPNDTNAPQYLETIFSDFQGSDNLKGAVPFARQLLGKTTDKAIKRECLFIIAIIDLQEIALQPEAPAAVDAFLADNPADDRAAGLLAQAVGALPEQAQKYLGRLNKDFPGSPEAEMAQGQAWRRTQVGKPFALAFTDAISGQSIDIAQYRGKVVVVDFWATWCGPCVRAMPDLKKTYEQYKDKGVAFVGVSLDGPESEKGLTKLKKFVADNQLPWPQYYQGNGWDSDFSKSWKVMSIPTAFVIDAQGNLASVDAFGRLDTLLPELLAKGK